MSTGMKIAKYARMIVLCLSGSCLLVASLGSLSFGADQQHSQNQKKSKKQQPQLPPLPSGPTGPVPQVPLDSIAPVQPQVSYENGQLTIVAPNSTLGDILKAVRKQTGADIDVPEAKERVVTHLGPAPARDVIADLLNGSRFNYVLLGSPDDSNVLTRVVLVAKTSTAETAAAQVPGQPNPRQLAQDAVADTSDEQEDNAADDNNNNQPPAEAEQQPTNQDQPTVKTPQQLLQEMQQRQLQMQQQQQQQPGQPPNTPPVQPPQPQQQ